MPSFIEEVAQQNHLIPSEIAVLRSVGVRSYEDIDSLLRCFPSIYKAGVRVPLLSNISAKRVGAAFAQLSAAVVDQSRRPMLATGALSPDGAHWKIGSTVPIPALVPPPPPPGTGAGGVIDLRASNWQVRDQGRRGTCVAFASTALVERDASAANPPDLSEQFLYWAIKTNTADPRKDADGTLLEFARDALQSDGICTEALWPYVGTFNPGNISRGGNGNPSAAAVTNAAGNRLTAATYRVFNGPGTAAKELLLLLQTNHRPVAITVPVFSDPTIPDAPNNWETASGRLYGRVLNPPPTANVVGGHAVCVVGYAPDSQEQTGGYFVIRNSWDLNWATVAPSPGYSYSPEAGYGDISATYIDTYVWEMLQL
jgi:hypothetical protein